jgi:hypothetical protein
MSSQNGSASLVPAKGLDATALPITVLDDDMARDAIKSSCSDLIYGLAADLVDFGLSLSASRRFDFLGFITFFFPVFAPKPFEDKFNPIAFFFDGIKKHVASWISGDNKIGNVVNKLQDRMMFFIHRTCDGTSTGVVPYSS